MTRGIPGKESSSNDVKWKRDQKLVIIVYGGDFLFFSDVSELSL